MSKPASWTTEQTADHPERRGPTKETPTGDDDRGTPVRIGRPPLDPANPPGVSSPVWHVRAPRGLDVAARVRAATEGRGLSNLVRDAVTAYLCDAPHDRHPSQAPPLDGDAR